MINILILAGGKPRFPLENRDYPLCMTEINGKTLLEQLTNSFSRLDANVIFALDENERKVYFIDDIIKILCHKATVFSVPDSTAGAACTALLATNYIDDDKELLIINANQFVDIDLFYPIDYFRKKNFDAGAIIFPSINSRYSYVKLTEENFVIEAAEKRVISKWATAGIYWFKNGHSFKNSCKELILKEASVNGKFYICPIFNELILIQKSIGVYKIDVEKYFPLKNERQLQLIEQK